MTTQISMAIAAELQNGTPKTQQDCCDMVAVVALQVCAVPKTDAEFVAAGVAGATGVFGEAWDAADEDQRIAWAAMYEQSLRKVAAAKGRRKPHGLASVQV